MATSFNASQQSSQGTSQSNSASQSQSQSFIPNYSQTPILEQIAQYAGQMAPQTYAWGMQQYAHNQGLSDQLINQANAYASPQRVAADMGMAEAGVQQSADAARRGHLADLESYGVDPSSGRYAELDQAERVQSAASAAGAGNQQRLADDATGRALFNQGLSSSEQNYGLGVNAENTANNFLGTAIRLPYSPLGNQASSASTGSSSSQQSSQGASYGESTTPQQGSGGGSNPFAGTNARNQQGGGGGQSSGGGGGSPGAPSYQAPGGGGSGGGGGGGGDDGGGGSATYYGDPSNDTSGGNDYSDPNTFVGPTQDSSPYDSSWNGSDDSGSAFAEGGEVDEDSDDGGGLVPQSMSPSMGEQTDDVPATINQTGGRARLNAEEFVIPRDVALWKGQEFFQNLIAKSRQNRVMAPARPTFNPGGAT